jgi:hypothetical protein
VAAVDQLTPAQTAALAEVTVEQFMDGRGEEAREVRRVRFRLASKIDALELLGKHHKLYVERHQHDWGTGLAERLAPEILTRMCKPISSTFPTSPRRNRTPSAGSLTAWP